MKRDQLDCWLEDWLNKQPESRAESKPERKFETPTSMRVILTAELAESAARVSKKPSMTDFAVALAPLLALAASLAAFFLC